MHEGSAGEGDLVSPAPLVDLLDRQPQSTVVRASMTNLRDIDRRAAGRHRRQGAARQGRHAQRRHDGQGGSAHDGRHANGRGPHQHCRVPGGEAQARARGARGAVKQAV